MFEELLCFPVQGFCGGKRKASSAVVSLFFILLTSPELLWIPGRGSLESREAVEQLALSENLFLLIAAQGTGLQALRSRRRGQE